MSNTQTRKADHLRICLEESVQFQQLSNGFERFRFEHCCLPELNYDDISLTTTFLGKSLQAPILISSMTGGTEQAKQINQSLAIAAQKYGLAMGVGSQRIAIEKPEVQDTFDVRNFAPDILLFANLGAVQLNYDYGLAQCVRAVKSLHADALILHLNPLQECIQPNGDRNFAGLLQKIDTLCAALPVPVIAKEVGNGISAKMATHLLSAGVTAIDVAGAGGTSWAKVESERTENLIQRRLGQTFGDWGLPTADCLTEIRALHRLVPLIASGGLRNGVDVAKAIALGANLVGLAQPFLQAAADSPAALDSFVQLLLAELRTALFCTGCDSLTTLQQTVPLIKLSS
ncbi:MAG: type 2 isopentenyl-diphosphate Delta-isomerase [Cyanobacteria bacterium P01_H01_bin.15]